MSSMDTAARAAWLAAHTFLCPHLRARLTPAQCAANRARPDVTDPAAGAWDGIHAKEKALRPSACGACQDWETLAETVGAAGVAGTAPALRMPDNLLPHLFKRELPATAPPSSIPPIVEAAMPQDAQAACPPPRGGFQPRGQNLARAQATYGEALPDWIAALARACDASTQREVAAQLGLSQPTVSRCCRTRVRQCYHIEELVRQLLMPAALDGLAPALMPDARLDARPDAQLANAFRRLADAQALAGRLAQALAEAQQLLFALQPQQIPQQVPQQMEVEHVHARESDHS